MKTERAENSETVLDIDQEIHRGIKDLKNPSKFGQNRRTSSESVPLPPSQKPALVPHKIVPEPEKKKKSIIPEKVTIFDAKKVYAKLDMMGVDLKDKLSAWDMDQNGLIEDSDLTLVMKRIRVIKESDAIILKTFIRQYPDTDDTSRYLYEQALFELEN